MREIYASDGEFTLYLLAEEDRESYIKLLLQTFSHPEHYQSEERQNMMWETTMMTSDNDYSIYNANGEYCGNVMLIRPMNDNPEIGIDLLEDMRNKGIGGKAIRLLAKKAYEDRPVEYFLLRVLHTNLQSIRMIEKLRAAFIGVEEESPYIHGLRLKAEELERIGDLEYANRLREVIERMISESEDVLQYKLTPDLFL